MGLTGEPAAGAQKAFETGLVTALANGATLEQAMNIAKNVAAIEASFPPVDPATVSGKAMSQPQAVARALSSTPGDQASTDAFNQSLTNSLSRGVDMSTAIQTAKAAAIAASQPATPATPAQALLVQTAQGVSSTSAQGAAPSDSRASVPTAAQTATTLALARGASPQEALAAGARAQALDNLTQNARVLDETSPARSLVNGNTTSIESVLPGEIQRQAFTDALARGMSPADALAAAQRSQALADQMAKVQAADMADPSRALFNGSSQGLEALGKDEEEQSAAVLALSRGESTLEVAKEVARLREINSVGQKADQTSCAKISRGEWPKGFDSPEVLRAFQRATAGGQCTQKAIDQAIAAAGSLSSRQSRLEPPRNAQDPSPVADESLSEQGRAVFNAAISRGATLQRAIEMAHSVEKRIGNVRPGGSKAELQTPAVTY